MADVKITDLAAYANPDATNVLQAQLDEKRSPTKAAGVPWGWVKLKRKPLQAP